MIHRFHHPDAGDSSGPTVPHPGAGAPSRLTLLLSEEGRDPRSFGEHLPRLLGPLGIRCVQAGCADEATEVIRRTSIHIAVIDLSIPLGTDTAGARAPAGQRVLQILRRLDQPPPTVVVRPQQWSQRESVRGLTDALREGAFAVLDRPVQIEALLEVLRRILRRHYQNHWPAC